MLAQTCTFSSSGADGLLILRMHQLVLHFAPEGLPEVSYIYTFFFTCLLEGLTRQDAQPMSHCAWALQHFSVIHAPF